MGTHRIAAFAAALVTTVGLAPAVAAPACRALLSDPSHDTTLEGLVPVDEPGADLLAVDLGATRKKLRIVTTIRDVDAPLTTSPLGRGVLTRITVGGTTFDVSVTHAKDGTSGRVSVHGEPVGGEWLGHASFETDAARNQLRVELPFAMLEPYAGHLGNGTRVTVASALTHDVKGTTKTTYLWSGIDQTTGTAMWTIGSRSCV